MYGRTYTRMHMTTHVSPTCDLPFTGGEEVKGLIFMKSYVFCLFWSISCPKRPCPPSAERLSRAPFRRLPVRFPSGPRL